MALILPDLSYDCLGCGRSCRHWKVLVDPQARRQLENHPLVERERQRGHQVFEEGKDGLVRLTQKGDACLFLRQNRCELHSFSGPQSKPRACQQFPFLIQETPDGPLVGLSFRCTAVLEGYGRPLQEHRDQLEGLLRSGRYPQLPEQVTVAEGKVLSWKDYQALNLTQSDFGLARELGAQFEDPNQLAARLVAWLEVAQAEQRPGFCSRLLKREPVGLARFNRTLVPGPGSGPIGWREAQIERYRNHLIHRKFVYGDHLLARLMVFLLVPPLIRFYSDLAAQVEGRHLTPTDLHWAISLVEGELVLHPDSEELYPQILKWVS